MSPRQPRIRPVVPVPMAANCLRGTWPRAARGNRCVGAPANLAETDEPAANEPTADHVPAAPDLRHRSAV